LILISAKPIDLNMVLSEVQDKSCGATVLFVGSTRDHGDRGQVSGIYYEAYTEMAKAKISEIATVARKRWKIKRFAVAHRTGKLQVGEVSVAVAVSAEHRREAFEACRYCIDSIKTTVPLWKKEILESGEAWVRGIIPKSGKSGQTARNVK
jgi:molybdopterin synthase catalytic subunit